MPLSMKVQPIGSHEESVVPRPLVKSRLRRLFRISTGGGVVVVADESVTTTTTTTSQLQAVLPAIGDCNGNSNNNINNNCFEPSSVCLAKMVENFIEESDKQQSVKCGRNRCNCFNGGSDSSDDEMDGIDAADFLKNLVVCESVTERNVLSDTMKFVESKNGKSCKRKDDLRKAVVESLIGLGYDASICRSKWEKSPSFPAGEYEYLDVMILSSSERLIVDVDFRSEFEIARSTKQYKHILQTLPSVFVGKPERLKKIIAVTSEAVKQSLKKKGMHFPPWRKAEYFEAKWLSPPTRCLLSTPSAVCVVAGSELSKKSENFCEDDEVEVEEKLSSNDDDSASASSSSVVVGGSESNGGLFAMSSDDDEVVLGEKTKSDVLF